MMKQSDCFYDFLPLNLRSFISNKRWEQSATPHARELDLTRSRNVEMARRVVVLRSKRQTPLHISSVPKSPRRAADPLQANLTRSSSCRCPPNDPLSGSFLVSFLAWFLSFGRRKQPKSESVQPSSTFHSERRPWTGVEPRFKKES